MERTTIPNQKVLSLFIALGCSMLAALAILAWSGGFQSSQFGILGILVGSAGIAIFSLGLIMPHVVLSLALVILGSPAFFVLDLPTTAYITAGLFTASFFGVLRAIPLSVKTFGTPLVPGMFALGAVAIVGAIQGLLVGNDSDYVFGDFFQVGELVISFLVTHYLAAISTRRAVRHVLHWTFAAVLFTALWQIYLLLRGEAASDMFYFYGGDLSLVELPRTISFTVLIIFPIALCAYPFLRRGRNRFWFLLLLVPLIVNIVLSFTRGLWLAALAAVTLGLYLLRGPARRTLSWTLGVATICLVLAALFLNFGKSYGQVTVLEAMQARFQYTFQELRAAEVGGLYQVRRMSEFSGVMSEVVRAPVMGNGLGATYVFSTVSGTGGVIGEETHYVHNLFLALLLRSGILGVGIFVWIVYVYFRQAHRLYAAIPYGLGKGLLVGFVCSTAAQLIVSMTSPTLINHPTAIFGGCVMAMTFQVVRIFEPMKSRGWVSQFASENPAPVRNIGSSSMKSRHSAATD